MKNSNFKALVATWKT